MSRYIEERVTIDVQLNNLMLVLFVLGGLFLGACFAANVWAAGGVGVLVWLVWDARADLLERLGELERREALGK
jgi:TRAP-type mannitol/chloroaromatic compound transport system permease large subunit